jgi:hypothetical protein
MRLLLLNPSIPTHCEEYVGFRLDATLGTTQAAVTAVYAPVFA